MKIESFKIKGSMTMTKISPNGDVETRRKDNLILNVGFDFIANALCAATNRPSVMGYTALGTGTTAVDAAQTALVTELARKPATYAHTAGTKVFTLSTTFQAGEAT